MPLETLMKENATFESVSLKSKVKYLCAEIATTKHRVGESQKFVFLRLNETVIKCPLI